MRLTRRESLSQDFIYYILNRDVSVVCRFIGYFRVKSGIFVHYRACKYPSTGGIFYQYRHILRDFG